MNNSQLIEQILSTWRIHNRINLLLIDAIPNDAFSAIPSNSRGRDVARQIAHTNRVRLGWLHYHETGKRPKTPSIAKDKPPTKAQLSKAMNKSGKAIASFLAQALRGEKRVRSFSGNPVRWMGYLIAHESHHRGSIMLVLKQNGMRLSEKIALQGLWGSWMYGREQSRKEHNK